MGKGVDIFSLAGKNALVTGASGYLGRDMVQILAEAGAHVLVNGRKQEVINQLVEEVQAQGLSAESAVFDVTDIDAIKDYFERCERKNLNILVNNAYSGLAGNIAHAEASSYMESYDVTVVAPHNLLNTALPFLRGAVEVCGDASIINIASMYGLVSPDQRIYESGESANPPFYGTAKAALLQWTRYAACEFGKERIRVNAISPGPFPAFIVKESMPDFVKKLEMKVPLDRIGITDDLKGPVLFLASSASSYVNGANLVVDGGWTCW